MHLREKAKSVLGKYVNKYLHKHGGGNNGNLHNYQNGQTLNVGSQQGLPACYIEIDPSYTLRIMHQRGELYPWLTNLMARLLYEMYDNMADAPNVKRFTLKMYPFNGVAFTKDGARIGSKEVHISSSYIDKIPENRKVPELEGVLCHEMVHAFQYDGHHTAPSGFIEGMADYFRLRMGLAPPHWNNRPADKWDAGYEKTGFFLNFIDTNVSPNAVKKMNLYLRDHRWSEKIFTTTCGDSAARLHSIYRG